PCAVCDTSTAELQMNSRSSTLSLTLPTSSHRVSQTVESAPTIEAKSFINIIEDAPRWRCVANALSQQVDGDWRRWTHRSGFGHSSHFVVGLFVTSRFLPFTFLITAIDPLNRVFDCLQT